MKNYNELTKAEQYQLTKTLQLHGINSNVVKEEAVYLTDKYSQEVADYINYKNIRSIKKNVQFFTGVFIASAMVYALVLLSAFI